MLVSTAGPSTSHAPASGAPRFSTRTNRKSPPSEIGPPTLPGSVAKAMLAIGVLPRTIGAMRPPSAADASFERNFATSANDVPAASSVSTVFLSSSLRTTITLRNA